MWVHHPANSVDEIVAESGELGTLRRMTSAFSFLLEPPSGLQYFASMRNWEVGRCSISAGTPWGRRYCWVAIVSPRRSRLPPAGFRMSMSASPPRCGLKRTSWQSFDTAFDTASRRWLEVAGTEKSLVCDDFVLPWTNEETRYWIHGDAGQSEKEPVLRQFRKTT